MEKQFVLEIILGEKYYNVDDLRYNQKVGLLFSKEQLNEFLELKNSIIDESNKNIIKLSLKNFNSKYCFFVNGFYLKSTYAEYLSMLVDDFENNNQLFFNRHKDDIMMSRIFSEV